MACRVIAIDRIRSADQAHGGLRCRTTTAGKAFKYHLATDTTPAWPKGVTMDVLSDSVASAGETDAHLIRNSVENPKLHAVARIRD